MKSKIQIGVVFLVAIQIHSSAADLQLLHHNTEESYHKYDANKIDSKYESMSKATLNPCAASPCGPHADCIANGEEFTCKCLPDMLNQPPNCRPECTMDSHCSDDMSCVAYRCKSPCGYGVCGPYADCRAEDHKPVCKCLEGYSGDPFLGCTFNKTESDIDPCEPNPCGKNAMCIEQNGVGLCYCLPKYYGNPDEGCMPKCNENSDCPSNLACMYNECRDPCPAVCPDNSDCQVENQLAMCTCKEGYTGDAYRSCSKIAEKPVEMDVVEMDACHENPCGPNSQCKDMKGMAVCSCLAGFQGTPPNCMEACEESDDCDSNEACLNQMCMNPCEMEICGMNTNCSVLNHGPVCTCIDGYSGDPFNGCQPPAPKPFVHPCSNSPCGQHSECRMEENNDYSCLCMPNMIGSPPNCHPECESNSDCADHMTCMDLQCKDPCATESCGELAICHVKMHMPVCECPKYFIGDPFVKCEMPECMMNDDCPRNKTCLANRCIDPCNGTCGTQAECNVIDHSAICTCMAGYTGDALTACHKVLNASIEFIAWFRTETSVQVMWRSDDPDNSSFTEYRVTIEPPDVAESIFDLDREQEPSKFVEAAFSGLIPGRAYNISVQTKLNDTLSMPVIVSYHTIPLRPMNLTLHEESLTSTSFQVNWESPKNTTEYDEYEVTIQSETGSLEFFEQRHVTRMEGEANGFRTKMVLEPGRTYQVTVKTVSGKARSWPETLFVTTKPLPVKNLQSQVDMETGRVTIWWQPNEMSRQDEYQINYFPVENESMVDTMGQMSTITNNTSYLFESLLPLRNYSLSVQAVSKHMQSNETTIYVLTPPSVEFYY